LYNVRAECTNPCRLEVTSKQVGGQYFFQERKYLRYEGAYHLCKENENYQLLATDIGQQTMKVVDRAFGGFFNLLKLRTSGQYDAKINLPKYLPKDGFFSSNYPDSSARLEQVARAECTLSKAKDNELR